MRLVGTHTHGDDNMRIVKLIGTAASTVVSVVAGAVSGAVNGATAEKREATKATIKEAVAYGGTPHR